MWKESVTIGSCTIELETGKIAKQAHGAVVLRQGNTVILSTVVYNPSQANRGDFLPLTVDYRENMAAGGRIPGGFLRREGRGNDAEILASRLCDRSLRPLFPKGFFAETQVSSTVHSYDPATDPPILSIIGAAAALHLSEIPWGGPLAAIRVGRIGGEFVAFPSQEELRGSELDLAISFSPEGVVMIEGGSRELAEADMLAAFSFAQAQVAPLLKALDSLRAQAGREKAPLPEPPELPAFASELESKATPLLREALSIPEKLARRAAIRQVGQKMAEEVGEAESEGAAEAMEPLLEKLEARLMREGILAENRRVDGREPGAIRPIACEVDWLPSAHGSALFTRGETQATVTVTLGASQDRMLVESMEGVRYERFLLHYNFPPYSVGEARPNRGPGRREVGHGALARRALVPVLPPEAEFPYTLRIVSEITESNGSSSMATVCGGTLALLDCGVPISAPVAGIAMGLVKEGEQVAILSDILGDEDHLGDMDFKVAGTANGITALQMDNKIGSLPPEMMAQAFAQAREGRLHILAEMAKAIAAPRAQLKAHVPLVVVVTIAAARVRDLIGPGGKVIQQIQRDTATRLEVNDEGTVRIFAPNRAALDAARVAVLEKAGSLEAGEVYDGVVTGVKEFGAFVRVRGQEGLVHISEWADHRVEKMSEETKEGDAVRIRVLDADRAGRLRLSRKAAL